MDKKWLDLDDDIFNIIGGYVKRNYFYKIKEKV